MGHTQHVDKTINGDDNDFFSSKRITETERRDRGQQMIQIATDRLRILNSLIMVYLSCID